MQRTLLSLLILLLLSSVSFARRKRPTLKELEESSIQYLYEKKKRIKVARVDTTKPVYYAYAYITLDVPFEDAAELILDMDNYEKVFTHILDVHPAPDRRYEKEDIWYIEGKTSIVHGWGLGVLKELIYQPDTSIKLKIRPAPSRLVNEYRIERKGKIRFYVREVHIDGMLVKLDDSHCRIGLRGVTSTNRPIPLWLLNGIVRIILPGMLRDVEKAVERKNKMENSEIVIAADTTEPVIIEE